MDRSLAAIILLFGLLVLGVGLVMPDKVEKNERTCTDVDPNYPDHCTEYGTLTYEDDNQFRPAVIVGGILVSLVGGVGLLSGDGTVDKNRERQWQMFENHCPECSGTVASDGTNSYCRECDWQNQSTGNQHDPDSDTQVNESEELWEGGPRR